MFPKKKSKIDRLSRNFLYISVLPIDADCPRTIKSAKKSGNNNVRTAVSKGNRKTILINLLFIFLINLKNVKIIKIIDRIKQERLSVCHIIAIKNADNA